MGVFKLKTRFGCKKNNNHHGTRKCGEIGILIPRLDAIQNFRALPILVLFGCVCVCVCFGTTKYMCAYNKAEPLKSEFDVAICV